MDEKRRQDERLQVRCTAAEKAQLQEAAESERRNLSNFVLSAALEKARKVLKRKAGEQD